MRQPAAKQDDRIRAKDTHIVTVPGSSPAPLPHPFNGIISGGLSSNVNIMGMPAATVDSTAHNSQLHSPTPPGTAFQKAPSNKATIKVGSPTVKINGKKAARNGDIAETCNDPDDLPIGRVIAKGTVRIG
jgi:uncharacterized Zn-binding protein involved in type VI secretion